MNALIEKTQRSAAERQIYVFQTIRSMINNGDIITVSSVADRCGVSRHYLYRHSELRQIVEVCRVTGMTKAELRQEVIRLRLKIRDLERLLDQEG